MQDLLDKTKKLCRKYGIEPARSKGQNFLVNEEIFDFIVDFAIPDRASPELVLEVGPGLGFMTEKLAGRAEKVVAVELDDKLAGALKDRLERQGVSNVEVVNEDILQFSICNFRFANAGEYKIVANLPYNISSIFLRTVFETWPAPSEMILMLQKEVAERIIAKPPKMNLLAVSVQYFSEAEILREVLAKEFWPEPAVDSAIINLKIKKLKDLPTPLILLPRGDYNKEFFQLVRVGFSARRKMLKNNLASGFKISQKEAESWLTKAKLDPKARAQNLSLEDWITLLSNKPKLD